MALRAVPTRMVTALRARSTRAPVSRARPPSGRGGGSGPGGVGGGGAGRGRPLAVAGAADAVDGPDVRVGGEGVDDRADDVALVEDARGIGQQPQELDPLRVLGTVDDAEG